ncbi:MAG: hypothetical protein LBT05_08410 [Planctomycetaceae bacterium]|jgi:hypothetical protein|nr:hypothetical protein [Planctomycetaceae bacterium]
MRWKDKSEYGKKRFGTRGLGTPDKRGKRRPLHYFYTVEQWEKAKRSPKFLAWSERQKPPPVKKISITIESRPAMRPAQETINEKIPELWQKAERYAERGGTAWNAKNYRRVRGKG